MTIPINDIIHCLHEGVTGALATHSASVPGYPFASALPYVLDEHHRPVWLLSSLAEHTKNLTADSRASFLVTAAAGNSIQTDLRMTMIGEVESFEPTGELIARYVRYEPLAQQYFDLGDFRFFRLTPKQVRYIAGFGKMGWIDESEWMQLPVLPLQDEADVYQQVIASLPPGRRLLGLDCLGMDTEYGMKRERHRFSRTLHSVDNIGESCERLLVSLGPVSTGSISHPQ